MLVIIGLKVSEQSLNFCRSQIVYSGYYGEGAETLDYILESVRREMENTDCLQGKVLRRRMTHKLFYLILNQVFNLRKVSVVDLVQDSALWC